MAPHAESPTSSHAEIPNGSANGNGVSATAPSKQMLRWMTKSRNVNITDDLIESTYVYDTTAIEHDEDGTLLAIPEETKFDFKVDRKVPKVGVMLVGWGGNNGTTVTAGIIANRRNIVWETKKGKQSPNYYGSMIMSSTTPLGINRQTGKAVNIPVHDLLPMVHPNDIVIGGWDISGMDLADAMDRAQVLEPTLKSQIRKEMATMTPLPSIYYPDFIAGNQGPRADNLIPGSKPCMAHVEQIRKDIQEFKSANGLDKVIVQWTANTERFADLIEGVNDTADNLMKAIEAGHEEVSPSTVFAVACILDSVPFINGSPQNTFVPGCIELAEKHNSFIGGDDFKSGQTKVKSALADFMINAGLKLEAVVSYNHLGNNDGKNLSEQKQFRSKQISKSNVIDDMVEANHILYQPGEHPDHEVVIKHVPAVGDDKRALDEYFAQIFLGGHQTIAMFNICEDSLLAAPLIIDLVIVAELMTRIQVRKAGEAVKYGSFHPVLSILSFMLKAPVTPPGTPVVNALVTQRAAMINIFRACVGLKPENSMTLEHKLSTPPKN